MEAMGYAIVDDAADRLGLEETERRVVDFRVRLGRENPVNPVRTWSLSWFMKCPKEPLARLANRQEQTRGAWPLRSSESIERSAP
jgi:hypothetical protein